MAGRKLTSDNVSNFTLKWSRPGSSEKIELFEAQNKNGATIFKVIDGTITELVSNRATIATATNALLSTDQTVNLSENVLQIIVSPTGADLVSATDFGFPTNSEWTENMAQWFAGDGKDALIFNYSTKVDTKATVDVYEQEIADFDGTTIPADDLLARVAGQVDQTMDVQNKYIKVFLNLDYAGARTSDLFSGRIQDSESRIIALIFPGDQIDLDLEGVNSELGLTDQLDKVMALKEVKTSTPVPVMDSDGNSLGYDSCSDATLPLNTMVKPVIQIPMPMNSWLMTKR